jgi:hypothetical protein
MDRGRGGQSYLTRFPNLRLFPEESAGRRCGLPVALIGGK